VIVCHCQHITDRDIHGAINWMREADAKAIITPRKVYRALGKSPDCGSCMSLFLSTMRKNTNLEVPVELRGLRQATASNGKINAG